MNYLQPAVKKMILIAGYYPGIFELVRRYHGRRGAVPILVYHRLIPSADSGKVHSSFTLRGLSVSAPNFEQQVSYLCRKYRLLSLPEYVKRRITGDKLDNCAVITFDDGFKDFKDLAWPILKKYQVPVTVFMPKSFLIQVHWQHRLYDLLDKTRQEKTEILLGSEKISVVLSGDQEKYRTIRKLLDSIRKLAPGQRQETVDSISAALGIREKPSPRDLYLTAADLRALVSEGLALGAHSVSHENLAELGAPQIDQEILESLSFIRALTGQQDVAFALPFSSGNNYVLNKIRECGCLCGFGNAPGLNTAADDIFQLKRIAALDFSLAEFAYNLCGAGTYFGRIGKE